MTENSGLCLVRLTDEHDLSTFDCGKPELNDWLHTYAWASQKGDLARTWVLLNDADRVIGYFSLVMGHVLRSDAPEKLVRGTPRYPIGMVLIARLAVDRSVQDQGLGAELLTDALILACRAGDVAAARLVAVDALDDEAAAFYRRWGFIPLPENPHKLFRRIKDIRRSVDDSMIS